MALPIPQFNGGPIAKIPLVRRDMSLGQNTRLQATVLPENAAVELTNVDITIPGQRQKRKGSVLIGGDIGDTQFEALHNYTIQGATDQLIGYTGTSVRAWSGTGNWAAAYKDDFTAAQTDIGIISAKESGLSPDDIILVSNGTDNVFRFDSEGNEQDLGDTNTSPPKSTVMAWHNNRVWSLKDDLLYFSDAYDDDYSGAFDRSTNTFRIPVGEERFLATTRDLGIIVGGKNAIWSLSPSATPSSSDQPESLVEFVGCVSKNGWAYIGDDIYFFAQDGLRGLKRTVQDKLQTGSSFPISFPLKDDFEQISWANIDKLSMKFFDNKLFICVPTGATTFSTWIYYPAYDSFTILDGWDPTCMETYEISGEDRMFYGASGDGTVYRGWYGFTDEGTTTTNGTAIEYTEISREEDFGNPISPKGGGELEIEALAVGDDNSILVEARTNGGNYVTLGTLDLQSEDTPTLPVALPFTLTASFVVRGKFHLDELGPFRTLQYRLTNSDKNTSTISIFGVNLVTFQEEYEGE